MTYEDVEFLYQSELVNRRQKKQFYSEPELILILYNFLQGAKEFQKQGIPFGDIRPKNILVTKAHELKMVNVVSFPAELTGV